MNGLEDITSKESKVSHAVALANQLLGIAPHVHTYNLVKRVWLFKYFFLSTTAYSDQHFHHKTVVTV